MTTNTVGQVKNVMDEKGFGFISTQQFGDVFFHKSGCGIDFASIKRGLAVSFNVVDTRKGKAAVDVVRAESKTITQAVTVFQCSRHHQPKMGTVLKRVPTQSRWYADPDKAKAQLKEMAEESGCNALTNIRYVKDTYQKGYNYYGTCHAYTADMCIVTEDTNVSSQAYDKLQHDASVELKQREMLLASVQQEEEAMVYQQAGFGTTIALLMLGAWCLFSLLS